MTLTLAGAGHSPAGVRVKPMWRAWRRAPLAGGDGWIDMPQLETDEAQAADGRGEFRFSWSANRSQAAWWDDAGLHAARAAPGRKKENLDVILQRLTR